MSVRPAISRSRQADLLAVTSDMQRAGAGHGGLAILPDVQRVDPADDPRRGHRSAAPGMSDQPIVTRNRRGPSPAAAVCEGHRIREQEYAAPAQKHAPVILAHIGTTGRAPQRQNAVICVPARMIAEQTIPVQNSVSVRAAPEEG
jgi:hypothetical protein